MIGACSDDVRGGPCATIAWPVREPACWTISFFARFGRATRASSAPCFDAILVYACMSTSAMSSSSYAWRRRALQRVLRQRRSSTHRKRTKEDKEDFLDSIRAATWPLNVSSSPCGASISHVLRRDKLCSAVASGEFARPCMPCAHLVDSLGASAPRQSAPATRCNTVVI